MPKPSTPAVWASGKSFGFQPSAAQQAQGFDYIAAVRPSTGAPITDDHDWPLNQITTCLKWVMDQLPDGGIQALLTALLPKRSFFGNDFIRIPDVPGGLIIQWGQVVTPSSGEGVQNFPTTFPNAVLRTFVTGYEVSQPGAARYCSSGVPTTSSIKVYVFNSSGQGISLGVNWIAVGF